MVGGYGVCIVCVSGDEYLVWFIKFWWIFGG